MGSISQDPPAEFCEDMLCTVLALPLRAHLCKNPTEYRYLQTSDSSMVSTDLA